MQSNKQLTITFESDWHIGSGAGIPKYIDRLVLRDGEDLPYIPGKTLTGILRDAAERLADIYAAAGDPSRHALVNTLFGATREKETNAPGPASDAKIQVRPARLAPGLRALLTKRLDLREALFSVQPGVKIDEDSGRAQDDHLFFLQKTRKGCVLNAEVTIEGATEDESDFLSEVVQTVRAIGGKRRRGAGACKLMLHDAPDHAAPTEVTGKHSGDWTVFNLTLTAETPTLIRDAVLGNVVQSLDHIPGTLLLGPLLRALQVGVEDVRVGPFYPALDRGIAQPVPLAFFYEKENQAGSVHNSLISKPSDNKQRKGYRGGYIDAEAAQYCDAAKYKIQRTHNTIDDEVQRPTEAVGGVFTYEAMPAGQVYRGQLRVRTSKLATGSTKFPARLQVGASKKDDYGNMRLDASPGTDSNSKDIALGAGNSLNVYISSDLLLADAYGAYTADAERLKEVLSTALGVTLQWAEDGQAAAFSRARRIESWQARWGLPRPTLVALQAGSVFRFTVQGTWDGSKAYRLQADGLGERRAEGFGQLLLNPPFLEKPNLDLIDTPPLLAHEADYPTLTQAEKELLQALERDAWKRRIRSRARELAFSAPPKGNEKAPSPSQWGALRAAASTITGPDPVAGLAAMRRWIGESFFDSGNDVDGAPGTWPKARRDKWGKQRDEIRDLLRDADAIWKKLNFADLRAAELTTSASGCNLKKELWAYAVRTYIDALTEAVFDQPDSAHGRPGDAHAEN